MVIVISAAVPAYATGDGNFDGGGGSMGDGTKTNYWNPGMDGVRVSIVDVGSHSVVRTPIDLTNKVPIANIAHFGKVSKLSYNAGRGLSVSVSGYSYRNPSQSLPKIISTSSSKASIAAIRSYFTDAVSYTHLDVYKRQAGEDAAAWEMRSSSPPPVFCWAFCAESPDWRWHWCCTCLLYTSRCV